MPRAKEAGSLGPNTKYLVMFMLFPKKIVEYRISTT